MSGRRRKWRVHAGTPAIHISHTSLSGLMYASECRMLRMRSSACLHDASKNDVCNNTCKDDELIDESQSLMRLLI